MDCKPQIYRNTDLNMGDLLDDECITLEKCHVKMKYPKCMCYTTLVTNRQK